MCRAERSPAGIGDLLLEVARRAIVAAGPKEAGYSCHAIAADRKRRQEIIGRGLGL
jgi:hypothetical protein